MFVFMRLLCVYVFLCVCSSCDMSSASVKILEAVDQDLDVEDAGKLTEADKAHTGRVSPFHIINYNGVVKNLNIL